MARFKEPTPAEEEVYLAWLADAPPELQAVARRFDPWSLYRWESYRVTIASFNVCPCGDCGAVSANLKISGAYNFVVFEREVVCVDPRTLSPCDLPAAGEKLGTVLTDPAEIRTYLEALLDKVSAATSFAVN